MRPLPAPAGRSDRPRRAERRSAEGSARRGPARAGGAGDAGGEQGSDRRGGRPSGGGRWLAWMSPPARRIVAYAAIAGPGVIAANAGNDAGGIATFASAGAQFAYRTLFLMVLITICLVMVQEMSVRLGTFTGKGLAALIREQFSLRLTGVALFAVLLANTGLVVSEFAGIGAAFELFHVSRYIVVPIAALAIWALVLFGSYRYAERAFLVLSLVFFAYPLAMLLGHPHWSEVGANLAVPHFLADKQFLLLGVALIGTTVSPYMQLYAASGVVDRGANPEDYRNARLDAVLGATFSAIISMTITIATAAAIGGRGPLQTAEQAAQALRPVAGSAAVALFAVGLFGASALAGAVVPLSSSYAISEAVGVERSVSRRFREAPLFLGLFTFQVFLGALVALTPVNLFTLLIGTQVLEGLVTPIVLAFILTLSNRRSLLGNAANPPLFRAVATVAVVGISLMSLFLLLQTVLGWFGV
ncbi:MAG TPA: divalent metal cation transporter [Acidimicrobiales bacterium]|nr:divalent metal cation transporter [Acidimicrobiales bacterium]